MKNLILIFFIPLFIACNAQTEEEKAKIRIVEQTKIIKERPKNYNAYLIRAGAKMLLEDYENALKDYNKAIQFTPEGNYILFEAFTNRGNCYYELNKIKLAFKDYNKAIKLMPTEGYPYFRRGLAKVKQGDKEGGCEDLQKATNIGIEGKYYQSEYDKYCK